MKKYMATIEGHPAIFQSVDKDGGQLCYARTHYKGAGVKESELYDTRGEVKKAILATIRWRALKGYRNNLAYSAIPIILGV